MSNDKSTSNKSRRRRSAGQKTIVDNHTDEIPAYSSGAENMEFSSTTNRGLSPNIRPYISNSSLNEKFGYGYMSSNSIDMPDIQETSADDSVNASTLSAKTLEDYYQYRSAQGGLKKEYSSTSRSDSEVMSLVGLQYVASETHFAGEDPATEQDLSGFFASRNSKASRRNQLYADDHDYQEKEKNCFVQLGCTIS